MQTFLLNEYKFQPVFVYYFATCHLIPGLLSNFYLPRHIAKTDVDSKFKGKENMFLIGMKSTSQFIKMLKGQLNCYRQ